MKVTTYFEVSAEAELAYNTETGKPCVAYVEISTEHTADLTTDEIQEVHDLHTKAMASQFQFDPSLLRRVSQAEYNQQMEGADDEDEESGD
jgi:hypothetical protein